MEYIVTRVRKELAPNKTHHHIEGVITQGGIHYTRKEVTDSIDLGNIWKTDANGYKATIKKVLYCPEATCYTSPYITTNPDSSKEDNLENLPEG